MIENITKLEAAERQLRVAIQLFFEERDPVAIETLTFAASQVLRDLGRHRGLASPIRDSDLIRPEYKAEWRRILNRAPNFLRHADRDPADTLEFRVRAVPLAILEAVDMFGRLEHRWIPETLVFFSWFVRKHPKILKPEAMTESIANALAADVDPDDFRLLRGALRAFRDSEKAGRWPPAPGGRLTSSCT